MGRGPRPHVLGCTRSLLSVTDAVELDADPTRNPMSVPGLRNLFVVRLRIGWVNAEDEPFKPEVAPVWCSQRDIVQLIEKCVDAPEDLRFDILYGISNNPYCWADVARAKEVVGYVPLDGGAA